MTRVPEAVPSDGGPTYQGRLLVRPDEEVVDQGLPFDVGTLVTRRAVLSLLGVTALAACTPSPATQTASGGEIPDETAGPYPGDGSNGPDVLEQSGVVRSDLRSSIDGSATAEGVAMTLTLTVLDMARGDVPFEGAAVYVWHCDRDGGYSLYSPGLEDVTYLRGVQVAGPDGTVTFSSVFPACYTGRWPHVHFEVYPDVDAITDATNAVATSQVALPQDVCDTVYATPGYEGSVTTLSSLTLATDDVFGDDGGVDQLGTVTGDVDAGFRVSLVVRVDTGTVPSGGGGAGGQPGGRG
ncbi:3,4-dioxygenase subunit beta [Cellulomonas sp. P5_C5]